MPSFFCKIWNFVAGLLTAVVDLVATLVRTLADIVVDLVDDLVDSVFGSAGVITLALAGLLAFLLLRKKDGDEDGTRAPPSGGAL